MNDWKRAPEPGALLPRTTVTEVCGYRDAAIACMQEAVASLERGFREARDALELAAHAHGGAAFTLVDRAKTERHRQLFQDFDGKASAEVFRQNTDACIWMNLVSLTGMSNLMDRTAKEQLDKELCGNVPEVTEENVLATFKTLAGDAKLIFQRGLARAFIDLDRRFRSHDGFKLGSRVILTHVFDDWGSLNWSSRIGETLADVQRVFAVLDGDRNPDTGSLTRAIDDDRSGRTASRLSRALQRDGMSGPRQSVTETPFFRVKGYKNGNAHLWFTRDDLVEKANLVLAAHYGEVLPDGVPCDVSERDIVRTRALSKDLAFYPTPQDVIDRLLDDVYIGQDSKVLEPSAGTGNIVRALLAKGATVDAVEIHPDRVAALGHLRHPRLTVLPANFLRLEPRPVYDVVVMNPPFYGTHWIEHVTHAYEFLAPGGVLVSVLPVSAELGSTTQHEAFRAWAKTRVRYGTLRFHDLPPESFADSGTRVNTVMLRLDRKGAAA
jgi:phospholipid N-methyltransferase